MDSTTARSAGNGDDQLLAVIAVGNESRTADGARFLVTSVELWQNSMFVVYCHLVDAHPIDQPPSPVIVDDLGNLYIRGVGGGSIGTWRHATYRFDEPLRKGARALFISPAGQLEALVAVSVPDGW